MLETLKRRQPRGVMGERFLANDLMGKPAGTPRLPDIARLQTSRVGLPQAKVNNACHHQGHQIRHPASSTMKDELSDGKSCPVVKKLRSGSICVRL